MVESGEVPQKPENLLYITQQLSVSDGEMDHHTKEMPTLLQFSH